MLAPLAQHLQLQDPLVRKACKVFKVIKVFKAPLVRKVYRVYKDL